MVGTTRISCCVLCWVFIVLALAGGGIVALANLMNSTWCAGRIVREFPSEYQDYAAVVGMISCGATGPDTSFVMIRRPNKKFDIAGDDYFFMIGGDNDIDVA